MPERKHKRGSETDTIWIISTRDPDGEPVCELTWGGQRRPLRWPA